MIKQTTMKKLLKNGRVLNVKIREQITTMSAVTNKYNPQRYNWRRPYPMAIKPTPEKKKANKVRVPSIPLISGMMIIATPIRMTSNPKNRLMIIAPLISGVPGSLGSAWGVSCFGIMLSPLPVTTHMLNDTYRCGGKENDEIMDQEFITQLRVGIENRFLAWEDV